MTITNLVYFDFFDQLEQLQQDLVDAKREIAELKQESVTKYDFQQYISASIMTGKGKNIYIAFCTIN